MQVIINSSPRHDTVSNFADVYICFPRVFEGNPSSDGLLGHTLLSHWA